jgi:hypothetical protein
MGAVVLRWHDCPECHHRTVTVESDLSASQGDVMAGLAVAGARLSPQSLAPRHRGRRKP